MEKADSEQQPLPNPFEQSNNPESDLADGLSLLQSLTGSSIIPGQEKPANFPSCFPIFYHNIEAEIPKQYQGLVSLALACCSSFTCLLVVSVFASFFSGMINSSMIISWREVLLSLFLLIALPIALIYVGYYPLYTAIRDGKSDRSIIGVQIWIICAMIFMFVGVPGTGIVGFWYAVLTFRYGRFVNQLLSTGLTIWQGVNIIMNIVLTVLTGGFVNSYIRMPSSEL